MVFYYDVPKVGIWYVRYDVPLDKEASTPLILLLEVHIIMEINRINHLCNTTELATCIDLYDKTVP